MRECGIMALGVCWSQNPCLPLNQLVFEHYQWPNLLSAGFYMTVGFLGRGGGGGGGKGEKGSEQTNSL